MATATIPTEAAVVNILPLMTITTDALDLVGICAGGMTGITCQVLVRSQKRITRKILMIELPEVPGVGGMAAVALIPQRALVMVLAFVTTDTGACGAGKLIADMAVLAGHNVVQADQGKISKVVVETIDRLPAIRDMTGGTNLHFGIFMGIIRRVTGRTITRQIVLQGAHMTLRTGELLMVPRQWKTCLPGVVELRLIPAHGTMAALALLAVAAEVDIVVGVTAVAIHRRGFLHHTIGVACAARQFFMLMGQGKVRGAMVKNAFVPAVDGVAGITLLAVFASVHIRRFMATDTGGFLKLITLSNVAPAAGHLPVQTF